MSFVFNFAIERYCGITKVENQCKGNCNKTLKSRESTCCNEYRVYRKNINRLNVKNYSHEFDFKTYD